MKFFRAAYWMTRMFWFFLSDWKELSKVDGFFFPKWQEGLYYNLISAQLVRIWCQKNPKKLSESDVDILAKMLAVIYKMFFVKREEKKT